MRKLLRCLRTFVGSCLMVGGALFGVMAFLAVFNILLTFWIIPTLSRFSYEMHLYFEQMEALPESVNNLLGATVVFVGIFPASAIAIRMMRGRKKRFIEQTEGLVSYADGYRFYLQNYGVYDGLAALLISFFFVTPMESVFDLWFGGVLGWILGVAVLLVALFIGVFFAEKHWRAAYLCEHVR